MVVVSHLSLFLGDKLRGRRDSYEPRLPLFGTIYFPIAPFTCFVYDKNVDGRKNMRYNTYILL